MRAGATAQAADLAATMEELKQTKTLAFDLEKRCGAFFSEMAASNEKLLCFASDDEQLRHHAKSLLAQSQQLQQQLDQVVADRDRLVCPPPRLPSHTKSRLA
jgi:septal ring factor EnvC (AmiA/AmiB activator)